MAVRTVVGVVQILINLNVHRRREIALTVVSMGRGVLPDGLWCLQALADSCIGCCCWQKGRRILNFTNNGSFRESRYSHPKPREGVLIICVS